MEDRSTLDLLARLDERTRHMQDAQDANGKTLAAMDLRLRKVEDHASNVNTVVGGVSMLTALAGVVAAFLALGSCQGCAVPAATRHSPTESVVALTDSAGFAYCTGVQVEQGILTAAHCLDGSPVFVATPERWVRTGHYVRVTPVEVLRVDEADDLALLSGVGLPPAQLGPRAAPGDALVLVGQPYGLPFVEARGYAGSALCIEVPGYRSCRQAADLTAQHGDSGGPLVDTSGRVVALLEGGLSAGFGNVPVTIVIPAEVLAGFLGRSR